MIFIRTNVSAQIGIGHLSRSLILAEELADKNDPIIILLDHNLMPEKNKLLGNYSIISLYEGDYRVYKNETEDANLCTNLINQHPSQFKIVIVDDYRLGYNWEKLLKDNLNKQKIIIAIDDSGKKPHYSDFLIDQKWEQDKTKLRYKNLISSNTIKLLGPEFNLSRSLVLRDNAIKKSNFKTILISIGGGGSVSILIKILNSITSQKKTGEKIIIFVVIGPYLSNKKELFAYKFESIFFEIRFLENCNNLSSYLLSSDLFIGAIGGTFYEANGLNLPAITFEISNNQKNCLNYLEDYGHYLHLGDINSIDFFKFGKLIIKALYSSQRLKSLLQNKIIQLDDKGPKRIVSIILQSFKYKKNKIKKYSNYDFRINKKIINNDNLIKIDDSYINKYLTARNLIQNRVNMLSSAEIPFLDHYLWWFENERVSYVYKKNGFELLYIWEKLINYMDKSYLIGGWFIANERCSPIDSFFCVSQQLNRCDILYPQIPWVASVKKDNIFVQKLCERLGFEVIKKGTYEYSVALNLFFSENSEAFIYYYRKKKTK